MAELERTFTIPLRKEWLKAPKYKRAKRTIAAVFAFLERHMKSSDVKLGKYLNLEVWKHGIKNPPSRIRVTAKKDDKGVVVAELVDAPVEKKEDKKAAKKEEQKVEEKKPETPAKPAEKKAEAVAPSGVPAQPAVPASVKPMKPRVKKLPENKIPE